jgi:tRNA(Arg) A34 adenosine deaminase TadA
MITTRDTKFMRMLRNIAIGNEPVRGAKLASAVVLRSDLISIGRNQMRSHPFQARFGAHSEAIFLHAETNAIHNALKIIDPDLLRKATLYVRRVKRADKNKRDWFDGNARPCSGCMRCITEFKIGRVVYSTESDHEEFVCN